MQSNTCFTYYWHLDESEEEITKIRIYGLTENEENICLLVDNFTPFIYLELPDSDIKGEKLNWTNEKAQLVGNKINELMGKQQPIKKSFMFKKRLYYANIKNKRRQTYPYLFLSFSNKNDIKSLSYKIRKPLVIHGVGLIKLKMHEQDANQILQLMCLQNLPSAGWIKFIGNQVSEENQITSCKYEYKVKWKNIMEHKSNKIVRPKVAAFDIEVNSTNPSAMPNANKPGDKVFQISFILKTLGILEEKEEDYLLSLGDPDPKKVGENTIIEKYKTESELLCGYTNFLKEKKPNIVLGYNIFGFDIPYMIDRAKGDAMCIYDFDQQGYLKNMHSNIKTIKWSSSAFKNQEFEFVNAEGILFIDLLPLIKRDYKLSSYTLNTVSNHFLNGLKKDDLTAKGIFKCYSLGMQGGKKGSIALGICGKYCYVEGTPISLIHGNISIEKLSNKNNKIMSWDEKTNKIIISQQTNYFNNGIQNCIELEFEDGRKISCTPDHLIATDLGEWVKAIDIQLNTRIKIGPILPNINLDTRNMILARIIGYLLTDEHIGKYISIAFIGNKMDAEIFQSDIYILCGITPNIYQTTNVYNLNIPPILSKEIKKISGIEIGNRTNGNHGIPSDILLWDNDSLKEFLGGIFGGDGWTPSLTKENKFSCIGLTQSRNTEKSIIEYMDIIVTCLQKFNILSKYTITERKNNNKVLYIGNLVIPQSSIDLFATTIGYRYCYHKTLRLSTVIIYYRFRQKVRNNRKELYDNVFKLVKDGFSIQKSYNKVMEYIKTPEYMPKYGTVKQWMRKGYLDGRKDQISRQFPNAKIFVDMINANIIFTKTEKFHTYAMTKDQTYLPVFSLKLINKIDIGKKQVYDIEIKDTHSYMANGIVSHNCVKDSKLVMKLFEKLQLWVGLTEQATTYNVPIFVIYTQGQQIKVYSQVYKKCLYSNYVVEKDGYTAAENEFYIGAKVFEPLPGVYDRVLPFDFASLYPTIIIAYNICWSTLVIDDLVPNRDCHVMEWDEHIMCDHDPKIIRKVELTKYIISEKEKIKKLRVERDKKLKECRQLYIKHNKTKTFRKDLNTKLDDIKKKYIQLIDQKQKELKPYTEEKTQLNKSKSKHIMCGHRKYRWIKEPKGVLPTIIQNLLDARANTRKEIKEIKDKIKLLDSIKDLQIIENYNLQLVVLDKRQLAYKVSANSVGGDTPVPCKLNGQLVYLPIEETSNNDWKLDIKNNIEIATPIKNIEIWSDKGFTKIKHVMRHIKEKPLKRILTHTGIVDCTDDHSLLRENGEKVKPIELKIGEKLLAHFVQLPNDTPLLPIYTNLTNQMIKNHTLNTLEDEMAFVWGLFFAEGTCGSYGNLTKAKSSWNIVNQDLDLLNRCNNILNKYYTDYNFKISTKMYSNNVYHLIPNGNIIKIVDEYRSLFYTQRNLKKIPHTILNSSFSIRQSFFMGYYAGDGNRKVKTGIIINNKGAIGTSQLYYLMKSLGYNVSISNGKQGQIYRLQCCVNFRNKYSPDGTPMGTNNIKNIYTTCNIDPIKKIKPPIIRNNIEVKYDKNNKISYYKEIKINCDRNPKQKTLDTIDMLINISILNNVKILEYTTLTKKLIYITVCCKKICTKQIRTFKKNINTKNIDCNCDKNINPINPILYEYEEYTTPIYKEYVYDVETDNNHFAAGIGDLIVHNSMYGALGVTRGYLPFMPGAMCVCAMGRQNINIVADVIPNKYGGKLIYGDTDSILPDCPLLILNNGKLEYKTIEEISDGNWAKTITGKEVSNSQKGLLVWSDTGFTEIKQVIRHAITKPLIRVTTHVGSVECSLDHSLLWENGDAAKGSDVKVGDKLCISELPLPTDTPNKPIYPNKLTEQLIQEYVIPEVYLVFEDMSAKLAFVWGLFYADGSCGQYKTPSGMRSSWAINNQDNKLLNRCKYILNKHEKDLQFKILDTMKSSNVNKLVPRCIIKGEYGIIVNFVNKYRELFYDCRRSKRVPSIILNSPFEIRQAFFMGYYAGDGSKKDPAISMSNKGAIGSAGLFYLMRSIGYQVSINTRADKPTIYKLTGSTPEKKMKYPPNMVKKIHPTDIYNKNIPLIKPLDYVEQPEYIYDIETENHHFAAGVGQLVVHNSNYITFPDKLTAKECWEHAEYVAKEVTKLFPPPMALEFENKIYWIYLILTKKRYMSLTCGKDGVLSKDIDKKGVLLARRDNSLFIRDIYSKIVMDVFNRLNLNDIEYMCILEINKLCSGSFSYENFIITKAVGDTGGLNPIAFIDEKDGKKKMKLGNYSAPILSNEPERREEQFKLKNCDTPEEYYLRCLGAHIQLAEKIKKRGNRVDAGTRLEYIITTNGGHDAKQYIKVEGADYFKNHRTVLRIDYLYYLKLLCNPGDQILNILGKGQLKNNFFLHQYKYRLIKVKLLNELLELFKPKLLFIE
jgi:DNA polymerase elongation subunit (family B)